MIDVNQPILELKMIINTLNAVIAQFVTNANRVLATVCTLCLWSSYTHQLQLGRCAVHNNWAHSEFSCIGTASANSYYERLFTKRNDQMWMRLMGIFKCFPCTVWRNASPFSERVDSRWIDEILFKLRLFSLSSFDASGR